MRLPLAPLVAAAVAVAPLAPPLAPLLPAARYLPTQRTLAVRLTGLGRLARRAEVEAVRLQVLARWDDATADVLVDLLEPIWAVERAARAAAPAVPGDLPVEDGVTVPKILCFDLSLKASNGPALGLALVTGKLIAAQVDANGRLAAGAVLGLRRLDDVLRRLQAADLCAQATGAELAMVLALYRTEGALAMPPSTASIAAGLPSGTTGAKTRLEPRPDISHLVVLINRAAKPDLASARAFGSAAFVLQIAGLDVLYKPGVSWAAWSRRVWREATGIDNGITAQARAAQLGTGVEAVVGGMGMPVAEQAWVCTVDDPVAFVALVLGEGVQLLRSLSRPHHLFGPGPALPGLPALGEGLAYLRYNLGDDQARLLLASAVRAVERTVGPRWRPLRQLVATRPGLTAELAVAWKQADAVIAGLPGTPSKADIARLSSAELWPVLRPWCAEPGHLDALTDFVERATWTEWSTGWALGRANVARYRTLLAFYRRL